MEATSVLPIPMLCPQCHQPVTATEYFCPNCGKPLKEKPPSTQWWTQLGIYVLSAALPPLGLWPAWKYLKSADPAAKRVGWIAIALTAISIFVSIWLFQIMLKELNQTLNAETAGLLGT